MAKDRELIRRTGIAVVQVPDGVMWNPGETVRLIVAIAASSDEHLGILANLMEVLDSPTLADRLAHTSDPADIIASLNQARDSTGGGATAEERPGAHDVELRVLNAAGLHARPATAFVEIAGQFKSEIRVEYGDKVANGKALASLLRLGIESSGAIKIVAWGPDADAALAALKDAVEAGLEEEDEPAATAAVEAWTPVSSGRSIAGVAAAPGLAIGPLYQFQASRIVVQDGSRGAETEHRQLREALATAREQLDDVYESVKRRSGKDEAAIFRAHQALLDDPELIAEVGAQIAAGHGAAWAWNQTIEARAADVRQVGDERLAGRAVDLHDVGQRVLGLLTFVIVGGGPIGVELAGAIAEMIRHVLRKDFPTLDFGQVRIVLVEMADRVLLPFTPMLSKKAQSALAKLGVTFCFNTSVVGYEKGELRFKDGTTLEAHTVIWAAGIQGNPLGRHSAYRCSAAGGSQLLPSSIWRMTRMSG